MKKFTVILTFLFAFFINAGYALETQVYTMPLFISGLNADCTWNFQSTSEIATDEIIKTFLLDNNILSPQFQSVLNSHKNDMTLVNAANTWISTQRLDVSKFAQIEPNQDKVLVIASGIIDKKGKIKDAWDTLKFSMDFSIDGKYEVLTKVILIDNKEGVILWQKNYSYILDTKRLSGNVSQYVYAVDEREKFRSFAHNIIARDVAENLSLRLNPKSIDYASKVKKTEKSDDGVGLKYYKNNQMPHFKITPPGQTMEERLRNDDSFDI